MKFLGVLGSLAILVGQIQVFEVCGAPTIDHFFGKTLLPELNKGGTLHLRAVTIPDCRDSRECCTWMGNHYGDMNRLYDGFISLDRLQILLNETSQKIELRPIYWMLKNYLNGYLERDTIRRIEILIAAEEAFEQALYPQQMPMPQCAAQ